MLGDLIVTGRIAAIDVREGKSRATGNPYRIVTAYIPSKRMTIPVTLGESLQDLEEGDDVQLIVVPSEYNGSVQFRSDEVYRGPSLFGAARASVEAA